jgi:hypothetical protein
MKMLGKFKTGAWCYYNNDANNGTTYGKLYNWYAVMGIYLQRTQRHSWTKNYKKTISSTAGTFLGWWMDDMTATFLSDNAGGKKKRKKQNAALE